jgi:membrane glycosyltransferase
MLLTPIYFGYPKAKVMDMTLEQKVICLFVILFNLVSMIFVSCWCYFQILRQRGKFGHNRVDVINDEGATPATPGVSPIKLNFFQRCSSQLS